MLRKAVTKMPLHYRRILKKEKELKKNETKRLDRMRYTGYLKTMDRKFVEWLVTPK